MGKREGYPYVEGTAALKIGRQRAQNEPRVIRVDFRAANRDAAYKGPVMHDARGVRVVPIERSARRRVCACAPTKSDVAVVVDALGLREMRDELERGTAAGVAAEGSFAVMLACCAALFAFCLLLLAL